MKEIKAYIKEHKISAVLEALRKIEGLTGVSISESRGLGIGWGDKKESYSNALEDCRRGLKLEIFCLEPLVDQVVAAIVKAAHTGLKGDGKIYVSNIEQAVRISTGQTGIEAV